MAKTMTKPEAPPADSALQQELSQLRTMVAALTERLAKLEEVPVPAQPVVAPVVAAPATPAPVKEEGISEEILLAISAAIAAFLGKRAHIRQVRLVRSNAWAQEGRAFIQASHHLSVQHKD
jgi:methylmalonyl-CoA carboxyltransferase 12S subunit